MHRVFDMPFSSVYPYYLRLQHLNDPVREFLDGAVLNPAADQITGVSCGVRVEEIDDPLIQKISYLGKLADGLARGKALDKVL